MHESFEKNLLRKTLICLLVFSAASLTGTADRDGARVRRAENRGPRSTQQASQQSHGDASAYEKRQLFSRPDWWPYEGGLGLNPYGHVPMSELNASDTLVLPNDKGSIRSFFRRRFVETMRDRGCAPSRSSSQPSSRISR